MSANIKFALLNSAISQKQTHCEPPILQEAKYTSIVKSNTLIPGKKDFSAAFSASVIHLFIQDKKSRKTSKNFLFSVSIALVTPQPKVITCILCYKLILYVYLFHR